MSRMLEQDIERKTQSGVGSVCWMSPESIGQQVYSKKSDVWMFGIVVWGPLWHLLVVSLDRSLLGSN
jgi:serine/threonine protein kinase